MTNYSFLSSTAGRFIRSIKYLGNSLSRISRLRVAVSRCSLRILAANADLSSAATEPGRGCQRTRAFRSESQGRYVRLAFRWTWLSAAFVEYDAPGSGPSSHSRSINLRRTSSQGRGRRALNVLHPAPIQLRSLLGRQFELAFTFGLREAFPQSHCELGPFAGGKFQQVRERRRQG